MLEHARQERAATSQLFRSIKLIMAVVVRSGAADPKRIGIMGGSYGGYMVTAGLTEYPDLFAAGADLFGIVNFETFLVPARFVARGVSQPSRPYGPRSHRE